MNSILSTALNGMTNAISRVDRAAQNIANAPATQDSMIEDIVDIKSAQHQFKANLAVLRVQNDMQDELLKSLDIKA